MDRNLGVIKTPNKIYCYYESQKLQMACTFSDSTHMYKCLKTCSLVKVHTILTFFHSEWSV